MTDDLAEKGTGQAHAGIQSLRQGRRGDASVQFAAALETFEGIRDTPVRRRELSAFGALCLRTGFADLATSAFRGAVGAAEELGDDRMLAEALLDLGNAMVHLARPADAERHYRRALELCLAGGHHDDAASALTNLAGLAAESGDFPRALDQLRASLDHLRVADHPDTEINTRVLHVQVLERIDKDPAEAIESARPLFGRFGGQLRDDQRRVVLDALRSMIDAYLGAHREIDAATWKARHAAGLPL